MALSACLWPPSSCRGCVKDLNDRTPSSSRGLSLLWFPLLVLMLILMLMLWFPQAYMTCHLPIFLSVSLGLLSVHTSRPLAPSASTVLYCLCIWTPFFGTLLKPVTCQQQDSGVYSAILPSWSTLFPYGDSFCCVSVPLWSPLKSLEHFCDLFKKNSVCVCVPMYLCDV